MILATGFFESLIEFEPLRYALIAGLCIGFIAPLTGSVVIIRRLSFIADTLSHFSLAGVTIGVFFSKLIPSDIIKINPIFMGIIFSIIGTFIIELLRSFYKNYKELSMTILLSLGVALSGLFIAITPGVSTSYTNALLFGSIMSVDENDIIIILITSVAILIFAFLYHKQIVSLCFDETYARVSGINVRVLQLAITIILAIVISVFMDLVGVLLISALLIVPVATAILCSNSFKQTITSAIIFSEVSILIGFYISYTLNFPIGATIVLFNILILLVVVTIIRIKKHYVKKEN
ncbi:MAG: metal ABC transporter permease [Acholeplasmataceae bacterium]|jgi:zinc transport system permease protein|nr:metal ABC transporter permease [Acholeplasmataceae bacterium]